MWPEEYGGRGLTTVQAIVWAEELARVEAPIQPPAGGELLVGPTLLHWGTERQKRRFLPEIVHGQRDLVPGLLRTRSRLRPGVAADQRGARRGRVGHQRPQDLDEPGPGVRLHLHAGPDQPEPRPSTAGSPTCWSRPVNPASKSVPIVQPDGTAGFSEVLFTNARCPSDNVVGGVDNGWTVAMSTLGFERGTSATSSWQRYERDWRAMVDGVRGRGADRDPLVRQHLARAWSQIQLMRINGYRIVTGVLHPEAAEQSRALEAGTKTYWTEFHQELTNLGIDLMGMDGQILTGGRSAPGVGLGHRAVVHPYPANELQSAFIFSRSGTIFGGTAQVQRNIIGERVLGLPKEPSVKA